MSIAAFTVTEFGMTMLSDGMGKSLVGGDSPMNRRKVWKLSQDVGLIWLGGNVDRPDILMQRLMGLSAREAIDGFSSAIKDMLQERPKNKRALKENPFIVNTFQFTTEGVYRYHLISMDNKNLTPKEMGIMKPGVNGVLVYDGRPAPWQALLRKNWTQYAGKVFKTFPEVINATESTCLKSFEEMIDGLKKDDPSIPIGGKIFMETISLPAT